MTQLSLFSQEQWDTVTKRVYASVGEKIQETRRIQHSLRMILCAFLVIVMFIIYAIALITA